MNPVHTTLHCLSNIHFNIIPDRRLGFHSGLFPSGFPHQYPICIPLLRSSYMSRPSHPPWLHSSTYNWWRVQVMKLFVMQFSPTPCHFIPSRPKYSPQHPVDWINQDQNRNFWGAVMNTGTEYRFISCRAVSLLPVRTWLSSLIWVC
jgi:hypothetical protein